MRSNSSKMKIYEVIKNNPGISAMPSKVGQMAGLNYHGSTYCVHIRSLKNLGLIEEIKGRYYTREGFT